MSAVPPSADPPRWAVGGHSLWFWGAHPAMANLAAYQVLQPLAKTWEHDEASRHSTETAIKDAATTILATDRV